MAIWESANVKRLGVFIFCLGYCGLIAESVDAAGYFVNFCMLVIMAASRLDMSGFNWRVTWGLPAGVNLRDGTANTGVILRLLGAQRIAAGNVPVEVWALFVPLRLTGALSVQLTRKIREFVEFRVFKCS